MNARVDYLACLRFGHPDRIPFSPGFARKSTLERWYREGLAPGSDAAGAIRQAYREAGGTVPLPEDGGPGFPWRHTMIPEFEEKVIERRASSQVVQDWKGNVCEIGLEFDVSYLRHPVDFVTRKWIACPVAGRRDWEEMKKRYDPEDPARLPEHPLALGASLRDRKYPVVLHAPGPYWQLREWCGFEGLSLLFYDDPALVEEMIAFWGEYLERLLRRALAYVTPDEFFISEDMAFKHFSMLSPAMVRRFLMPTWRRWGDVVRAAGVPLYTVDSDGYVGELIPLWIESGIQACDPVEVAAGNDIVAFRRRYGRAMAYRGGVDKRAMATGGKTLAEEIGRLSPVVESGGYIPECDHAIPHDVPWPHFVEYCRLLGRLTGWLSD